MKTMKKTHLILITILLGSIFGFLTTGCSTLKEVPEDMSAAQLIQQGQNAYGLGDYKAAQMYYNAVIDRFGDDTSTYVEARYELGHLFLKTKDYKKAYAAFSEILELYDSASGSEVPPSYKKLAEIGIERIPENRIKN